MLKELFFYRSDSFNPFLNQGIELYLLEEMGFDTLSFYLWQNDRTVVIGRNQDAAREVNYELLETEGGHLARRLSGGGAVYHDIANLNFTFACSEDVYDVARQSNVIVRAMHKLGLNAELSGRNDITIDGAKFSGNAYYHQGKRHYQHGTILLDVDTEEMARYLKPSKKKLVSKGVSSVKSRVVNLKSLKPDLSIDTLAQALLAGVEEEYGLQANILEFDDFDKALLKDKEKFFADDAWRYGRNLAYDVLAEERFDWGEIQVKLAIKDEEVQDAQLNSDAMDSSFIASIQEALVGKGAFAQSLAETILSIEDTNEVHKQIKQDIAQLLQAHLK
ncbi:MAG: lipoate--protein ligase [Coriobacteriia bacterium]|nr:lipoate--protein ligase [Coriobacteriia bacterium]